MNIPFQKKESSMLWGMASDLSGSDGDGLLVERENHQPSATGRPITVRRTKTVRFPDDGSPELERQIFIPSLSESSPEELSNLYTTERDHQRAMLDARDCILFVRRRQHLLQHPLASASARPAEPFVFDQAQEDATGYCLRGLESMQSKSILELSALRKRLVRDTVLLEQKRGNEGRTGTGNNDHLYKRSLEERVAAASAEASSWARDRAYERAAADAAWVQQHVLLEDTLAAALDVHQEPPPHESQESLIKKRRRRSSVTFCPTTRLGSSSFCSTSGEDDGSDPKGLAQSFRRLSCKGSSASGAVPQAPTSPRAYAYRPAKKTVTTHARITSSPSA